MSRKCLLLLFITIHLYGADAYCPRAQIEDLGCVKAPGFDDRKAVQQTDPYYKYGSVCDRSNRGSFHASPNPQFVPAGSIEPPKIGNLSLPTSQQPAGLFGFGENIIDKGQVQVFLFADSFVGSRKYISDAIPSVLFGITDDWSIFFTFPVAPYLRDGCDHSSGLEDFFVQLEYAFYNKKTATYIDQATIVGNISVPTGSVRKDPNTGFGAPTLFIGATYNHMMVDWFVFTAPGAILTLSNHRTKIGDQFLYQLGFGRNIPSPCGWIYAWMIEVDGQYFRKNRICGKIDPNSGGNFIFVTPSIWISNRNMLLQFGVGAPILQNTFGKQRRIDYEWNLNFAWTFYP